MQILETERLIIRHLTLEDNEFILQLVNSPNWLEFIGDRNIKNKAQANAYIYQLNEIQEKNSFTLYAVTLKENQNAIGLCGFLKRDYLDSADIGFAILPDYERKGYVFEAAKAILEYGIQVLQLKPIYAITDEKNIKSQNLLLKLGLQKISTIQSSIDNKEFLLFELKYETEYSPN